MRPAAAVDQIASELAGCGTPERAAGSKAYLKSDLQFLGVRTPDWRRVLKSWLKARPELTRKELLGVGLLKERTGLLESRDLALLEAWLRDSHTWALVDHLAIHVVGPMIESHPHLVETIDRWAEDDDFWIRRSALLALLLPLRRGQGDWKRFARYADTMLEEREFFIRKAIGWVLREVSKKTPARVRDFVASRTERISGVSLREAVKYLPPDEREALLAAYRSR